jgi:hypothetical protein
LSSAEELGLLFVQLEKAVDSLQVHAEQQLRSLHPQPINKREYEDDANYPTATRFEPVGYYSSSSAAKVSSSSSNYANTKHFIDGVDRTGNYRSTSMPDRGSEWGHAYEASYSADPAFNQPAGDEHLAGTSAPHSKKRKRNKPTLSCKECVDKKIKVSRHKGIPLSRWNEMAGSKNTNHSMNSDGRLEFHEHANLNTSV